MSVSRDLSEFDQLEAEHFDVRKNAERRGPILKYAGEHRLAARQLRQIEGNADRAVAGVDWASEEHAIRLA
jgi:hypothetical protein